MKRVRYTKYNGDLASEMEMDDLLKALSDYLLDSGYRDPFTRFSDLEQTMSDLKEALRRALEAGDAFEQSLQEKIDEMAADGKLDELIDQLIERMEKENYLNMQQPRDPARTLRGLGNRAGRRVRSGLRSLTRALIFWASRRFAICLVRWANRASAAMTRGTGRRASNPAELPNSMSLATC